MNVDHSKELTHISLCTGYGGIDLGLKRAIGAVRTVCYVEIEAFVIENLVAKVEAELIDPAPIFTNLKTFPWEQFSGRVDILSGGFPCQPFSAAGRKGGDEDPRHLWPYIVDGIKRLGRPPIVFFENVEGILSSQLKSDEWSDPEGTPVLLHVHRELEKMGYRATSSVFSASEIGAPHRRKRVFILGVRNDLSDEGREWVSQRVGYTKSQQDRIREIRHLEETGRQGSSPHYATWFTSGGFRTAYPAPREAEQYPFEPPRVTLGDTLHDGSPIPKKCGNTKETGDNNQEGQEVSIESERASRSKSDGYIQGSELGNTNGGGGGSHGGECWLLPSETGGRETDRLERTGDVAELGDSYYKGLERRCQQKGSQTEERRDSKNVSSTSAGTTSGELQGEAKSEVGGDVDGATRWMGNAELYESCDNRTDELRMLGNGVVPDTARRAFEILWEELAYTPCFTTG